MGKRVQISVVWKVTFVLALASAAVISFFALQIPSKEMSWKEYQQTQICSEFTCRQIQTAVIVKSQTLGSIIKEKSAPTQTDTEYYVQVDLGNQSLNEFYVTTKLSIEKNEFGVPHIYLPNKTERDFMRINFPAGKEVKLELWKGRVTFMFTAYIGQQTLSPMLPSNSTILEQDKTSTMNAFAIPTFNHPLVALKKAQKDLWDAIWAIVIIAPIMILLTYYYTRKRLVNWRPNASSH